MARSRQKRSKLVTAMDALSPRTDEAPPRRSETVGATLRGERERRNWDLASVAQHLKIRRVHLEAIEQDRFDLVPSGTYAVNFVRAYSEALGLDATEMVRRFREDLTGNEQRLELNFPQPLPESRLPGGVIILVSIAVAALAYGAWTAFSQGGRELLARVDPVPLQLQAAVPAMPPPAAPPPVVVTAPTPAETPPSNLAMPTTLAPATAASIATTPAPAPAATPAPPPSPGAAASDESAPSTIAAAPPPAPVLGTPPVAPALAATASAMVTETANGTRIFGDVAAGSRVVITAQADSWVQVRDGSGAVLFMRILKAGDAYHVPNRQGLLLTTGSAGSIELKVDGKVAPALGKIGFVRRDVPLEPERLSAGTAGNEPVRPPGAAPALRTGG